MNRNNSNKLLEYIQEFLIQLAAGNFDAKLNLGDDSDDNTTGVQVGINMLVEELQSTTISRQYLNNIYNGINEILIVLNDKGEIKQINQIGASILQYDETDLINQPIEKLIHLDSINTIKTVIKNTIEQKKSEETGLNFITKDNQIITTSCSFSYLYDNQFKSHSILMLAKDIAILLDAKKQLENKSEELNLFVYKASHDLKSPVASMLGLMSLAEKTDNAKDLKEYIKLLGDSTKKMASIINDLLIIGQITYGKLDTIKIDVEKIIVSLIEDFKFHENFKRITFDVHVNENAKYIITEEKLLRTILFNLIDNALKYSRTNIESSYIKINTSAYQQGILIEVEDNGIGIDETLQKDVFKMFHRATYVSKGSGLGLYIANMSAQKLEGNITLESILNSGSKFKVYIPSKIT